MVVYRRLTNNYKYFLLIVSSLLCLEIFAQNNEYTLTEIGIVSNDGYGQGCSGTYSMAIEISSFKNHKNRVKIKGRVLDKLDNYGLLGFDIYKAYNDTISNQLKNITMLIEYNTTTELTKDLVEGKFKIRTILPDNMNIYFEKVGYSTIELKKNK